MSRKVNNLMYAAGPGMLGTIRTGIELTEPVDRQALEYAARRAAEKFPYFAVKMARRGSEYVLEPNCRPFVISPEGRCVTLGSEESNGHLFAFAYDGNRIFVDTSHFVTDGTGKFPFIKTVLYYYLSAVYPDESFETQAAAPDGGGIPLAEAENDPYPAEPLPEVPLGTNARPEKVFMLPDQPQGYAHADEWTSFVFSISQKDMMAHASSLDGSPATYIASLMYKAITDCHPGNRLPVVCGMQHQFRTALGIGLVCCAGIAAATAGFSPLFAALFFARGTALWDMGQQMFRLGFLFFPFNIIFSLLLNSYQAQGKMKLVNVLSAAEPALIGLTALVTVPLSGLNAAWLANTWVDLACIGIILAAACLRKGGIDLRLPSLLKLDGRFGAQPGECREYSVNSVEDVVSVSGSICAFCKERGIQARRSFFAGLCVEEMARNILEYGTRPGKHPQVDVRVVAWDELTVRIRDNCPEFDSRKRVDQFDPADPERNIGIRLAAGISDQVDYYSQAGVNTLIMKI